jgi:hypothetical protein
VLLANRGFVDDAHSAASSKNMPTLRVLGEPITCESTVAEDIESGIDEVFDDIVAALTRPLTEQEKSPQLKTENAPRIAFKGNLMEVNQFFYRKGWGDGLPIIPPSEEAVAEMMEGTDLPADHVVAKIIPRLGKATVEKIAVNAVMAGALPVHMPVLIAAVQAVADPTTRFDTFEVSTGSWAPFLVINGPIRKDIHVNSGSGALSPGNLSNSAIGRALGLIVKNIGGARKGIEDMGTLGNPGKYSLVLAENEEDSPWEPLHVERGFKKEDSTVTIFFPNQHVYSIPRGTDAKGILDSIAGLSPRIMNALMIIPSHADILASEGWTKSKVREYVMKLGEASSAKPQPQRGDAPAAASPNTPRDALMIVVAGGAGTWYGVFKSTGGGILGNDFVSKKIELPKNWNELTAKYENLIPTYVRY